MTNLLILLVLTTLFIQGWDYCLQYDAKGECYIDPLKADWNPFGSGASNKEFLWFVKFYTGNALYRLNLMWLAKPMLMCRVCMAGPYGTLAFWAYMIARYPYTIEQQFLLWPAFCIALAGINRLLIRLS